ncbi:MAG: hypothetical protein IJ658_05285 [Kiritimatiellae bacterium]|nr:hypothetical protein [Kiritimatiellia bacterium]
MNKALHALVYVILAVAGVALFFEIKLYEKRELLSNRNDQFADSIVKVAGTIEKANAAAPANTEHEAHQDVSPVEAKEVDTPQKKNLLEEYNWVLEAANNETFNWGSNERAQLRVLYKLDDEGNKIPDPGYPGSFVKSGPGTAQELLDQLFERAKAQRANLDTTRAELKQLRQKLEGLVREYNERLVDARKDKATIVKHEGTIADLEDQKKTAEEQLQKTKAQVEEQNAEIASLKDEITNAKEETEAVKEDLAKLEKTKEQLVQLLKKQAASQSVASATPGSAVTSLPAGDKGKLVYVNNELMFAIVQFSDEAMQELLGPERQNPLPPLEMGIVRRKGGAATYVGHVRLRQIIQGKNYVMADILRNWEQAKAEKDDVIIAE